MTPEDEEKTVFITDHGLFCYMVMSFSLNNVGAIYQRLVDKIFKDQLGRNMEAYVDDMLVKSQAVLDHIADLQKTFNTLRRFQMRLNPAKCAFGVIIGEFLGFMISQRDIEVNFKKIRVILEMTPSSTVGEMQRITDRITSLNRCFQIDREVSLIFSDLKQLKEF